MKANANLVSYYVKFKNLLGGGEGSGVLLDFWVLQVFPFDLLLVTQESCLYRKEALSARRQINTSTTMRKGPIQSLQILVSNAAFKVLKKMGSQNSMIDESLVLFELFVSNGLF